jgi:hypothetical protein
LLAFSYCVNIKSSDTHSIIHAIPTMQKQQRDFFIDSPSYATHDIQTRTTPHSALPPRPVDLIEHLLIRPFLLLISHFLAQRLPARPPLVFPCEQGFGLLGDCRCVLRFPPSLLEGRGALVEGRLRLLLLRRVVRFLVPAACTR